MKSLPELTDGAKRVMRKYSEEFPEVEMNRDYFPLKLAEEWGECLQAYLMLTDRGRQKGKTKDEIRHKLEEELGDVFGFLLLFAESEGVDLAAAIEAKWFSRLKAHD